MPDRDSTDQKTSRPPEADRAEAAAEAARKRGGAPAAEDQSAARAKREAKGLTKVPKRLSALS